MSDHSLTQTILRQPTDLRQGVRAHYQDVQRLLLLDDLMAADESRDAAFFLATVITLDSLIDADFLEDIDHILSRFSHQCFMNRAVPGLMESPIAMSRDMMREVLDDATTESGGLFSDQMWRDVTASSRGAFHLGKSFPSSEREVALWSFSAAVHVVADLREGRNAMSRKATARLPV